MSLGRTLWLLLLFLLLQTGVGLCHDGGFLLLWVVLL
jgi:hypothetical protein